MNASRLFFCAANRLIWLVIAASIMRPLSTVAVPEQTFEVLQIGTQVYRNVTVTTKAKNYIFIFHSGGMTNIKLSELSPELQKKLGYDFTPKTNAVASAAAWAKAGVAKIEGEQVREMKARVVKQWQADKTAGRPVLASVLGLFPTTVILALLGVLLLAYVFRCFCLMQICRKAGQEPGILVWLPLLQLIPMLRAAKMSEWWFVAWFVPLFNVLADGLWCLNIAKARGKSVWAGMFLWLPLTRPFTGLYLAFSGVAAPPAEEKEREPEIMSLQSA